MRKAGSGKNGRVTDVDLTSTGWAKFKSGGLVFWTHPTLEPDDLVPFFVAIQLYRKGVGA